MPDDTFDIDDLSQVIRIRAEEMPSTTVPVASADDVTIPIMVEEIEFEDDLDSTLKVVDALTRAQHDVYRCDRGRYLRYRIGVLGIGASVEEIYQQLRDALASAEDQLDEEHRLWARYEVGLFGGQPKEQGVVKQDAVLLADKLAVFRPNYLILVNAGHVRQNFAERTPQQLALLTRCINQGALRGAQRPYTLVMVVNQLIPEKTFAVYMRAAQALNTHPAMMQFQPHEVTRLIDYARFELRSYTRNHLELSQQ